MKCLELVVYTIVSGREADFLNVYGKIRQEMSAMPGFHSAETLRALDHPSTFADIWIWDSLEQAKDAHSRFASLPHAKSFMALVEKVHYSDHFIPAL